ncbi:MAG: FHA domain-containing protein [Propionibacteriaceae bacterium]|nr:FHA domain-containing protein [Propionibacteriaceae bacterium]
MPICPAGHHSAATDFCDTCGLPLPAAAATPVPPPAPAPLQPPAAVVCPACGTPNVADALFCEACGHDFIGGANAARPATPTIPAPEAVRDDTASDAPADRGTEPAEASSESRDSVTPDLIPGLPPEESAQAEPAQLPSPVSTPAERAPEPPPAIPGLAEGPVSPHYAPRVDWIAELWIDPDWYAAQGSTDPLPSPGLPDIVPLVKESNLIGRVSTSRNIYPEVDCELDTGCSRRHARLTTDGTRWWIEDLESANGTFLGTAAGPLPAMPIPRGKVELAPDQRIYLGAWTRIVVRRATQDEQEAFAGLTS